MPNSPQVEERFAKYRAALAKAGGYAFPLPDGCVDDYGMTLRDYFAASVAGHIWDGLPEDVDTGTCAHTVAVKAYIVADAMLYEREK